MGRSVAGVGCIRDCGIGAAGNPVLGAEQCDELYSGCVREDVDRSPAIGIPPRLIRDQADTFAAKGRKLLLLQDVDASFPSGLRGADCGNGRSLEPKESARQADKPRKLEENGNETCLETLDCAA